MCSSRASPPAPSDGSVSERRRSGPTTPGSLFPRAAIRARPDRTPSPRATAVDRRAARVDLDRRVGEWTATRDRDEVVKLLRSRGLRAAPVLAISELFSDAQLAHRGTWPIVKHPTIGDMRVMAPPFRLT